jgi:hypothetical protein
MSAALRGTASTRPTAITAGGSSTTTGVGGVGAYHHHHRGRVGKSPHPGQNQPAPDNTTSDLVDLLKASNESQQTRGKFFDKFA